MTSTMSPPRVLDASSTTNRPSFHHSSLAKNSFRLLKIVRIEPEIFCSLRTFSLDKCPPYEAISYCWGTENLTETFICNDAVYQVTPHLQKGLRCLFAAIKPKWIWIDAICIHQSDDVEKSSQVAQMYKIFSAAARVIVWLGPAQDDSDLILDQIPTLSDLFSRSGAEEVYFQHDLASVGFPKGNDPVWQALYSLFDRGWFRRLWVIQEAVKAKELIFLCGYKFVSGEQFKNVNIPVAAHAHLQIPSKESKIGSPKEDILSLIYAIRNASEEDGLNDLVLGVVSLNRLQETTDPLDRVYAILGIFGDDVREGIVVNYSSEHRAHCSRLYVQFYKSLLLKFGFSTLFVVSSQEKSSDLPSWCPDLNSEPEFSPISGNNWAGHNLQRNSWQPQFRILHVSLDSDELKAHGSCVDVVVSSFEFVTRSKYRQELVGCNQDAKRASVVLELLHNSLGDCAKFLSEHENQLNPHYKNTEDLFRKTLIAGGKMFSISHGYEVNMVQSSTEGKINRIDQSFKVYFDRFIEFSVGRSFFITAGGRFGLGPGTTQTGDRLCVLFGAKIPYLLRPELETSTYKMVGDVYVDDLMKGEVFELRDFERDGYDTFVII